jgi:tRNA A37 threonylcarbamoyladenosine dehydratase
MARKFAHEEAYRGDDLLRKLEKQVVICGAGALGSNLADTLYRQGFTKVRVIDMDRVEGHNVNTQFYGSNDVGAMKVNALKTRLFRDTGVEIENR